MKYAFLQEGVGLIHKGGENVGTIFTSSAKASILYLQVPIAIGLNIPVKSWKLGAYAGGAANIEMKRFKRTSNDAYWTNDWVLTDDMIPSFFRGVFLSKKVERNNILWEINFRKETDQQAFYTRSLGGDVFDIRLKGYSATFGITKLL